MIESDCQASGDPETAVPSLNMALEKKGDDRQAREDITRANRCGCLYRVFNEQIRSAALSIGKAKDGRLADYRQIDLSFIGMMLMDTIAERMELSESVDCAEVISCTLASAMDMATAMMPFGCAVSHDDVEEVVTIVFSALCNASGRYASFDETYWDAVGGVTATRSFWLIKTAYDGTQAEALDNYVLTPEAYQLYLSFGEIDGLDNARLHVLRLEMLIKRNALKEALSVAETNARHSRRLVGEIKAIKRQITRNIDAVKPELMRHVSVQSIEQAQLLVKDLETVGKLVHTHRENAEEAQFAQLNQLSERLADQRHAVTQLVMEQQRLTALYRQHQVQMFRMQDTLGANQLPSLMEVFKLASRVPLADTVALSHAFIAWLNPPIAPDMFDPGSLLARLDAQLDRDAEHDPNALALQEEAKRREAPYASPITDSDVSETRRWLTMRLAAHGSDTLSSLLPACDSELGPKHAEILQMLALFAFTPNDPGHLRGFVAQTASQAKRYQYTLSDGSRVKGLDVMIHNESKERIRVERIA